MQFFLFHNTFSEKTFSFLVFVKSHHRRTLSSWPFGQHRNPAVWRMWLWILSEWDRQVLLLPLPTGIHYKHNQCNWRFWMYRLIKWMFFFSPFLWIWFCSIFATNRLFVLKTIVLVNPTKRTGNMRMAVWILWNSFGSHSLAFPLKFMSCFSMQCDERFITLEPPCVHRSNSLLFPKSTRAPKVCTFHQLVLVLYVPKTNTQVRTTTLCTSVLPALKDMPLMGQEAHPLPTASVSSLTFYMLYSLSTKCKYLSQWQMMVHTGLPFTTRLVSLVL